MNLEALEGDSWTYQIARLGLPILVEYAYQRKDISYSEWDEEIVKRGLCHHVHLAQYGHPAGVIGDACIEFGKQTGQRVPAINLLVVSKSDRMPGHGADYYIQNFCQTFLGKNCNLELLDISEKRSIVDRAKQEIFNFQNWDQLLSAYDLGSASKPSIKKIPPIKKRDWHTGPESDAHKALKKKVALSPWLVGLPENISGKNEVYLESGDKLDVFFSQAKTGIEIKTNAATTAELRRGIFQCVKYRETLKAQQIASLQVPTGNCFLGIGGKLPLELVDIARRLNIHVYDNLEEDLE